MSKNYVFYLAFAGSAFFFSCKKKYSCQCTSIYEKPGYYPLSATSIEPLDEKTTKRKAGKICTHAEKQIARNNQDYANADEQLTVSCAVK